MPGWDGKDLDKFNPVYVKSSDDVSQDLLAERTERWGTSEVNCCSYFLYNGYCVWSSWTDPHFEEWNGAERLREDGTIGLMLDLNEGTLAVYKNGRRLGVMKGYLYGQPIHYTSANQVSAVIRN